MPSRDIRCTRICYESRSCAPRISRFSAGFRSHRLPCPPSATSSGGGSEFRGRADDRSRGARSDARDAVRGATKIESWAQALSFVRARSPDYLFNYATIKRAEAQTRIALASLLPVVNGTGSYVHNFYQVEIPFGTQTITTPPPDTWNVAASASWTPLNVRAIYDYGTSKANVTATELSFDDKRRQIALSLVTAILATLFDARRRAQSRRAAVCARAAAFDGGATRVGQGTPLDVDRANADVAAARRLIIDGDESLRRAREALGLAIGSAIPWASSGCSISTHSRLAVSRTCRLNDEIESRPDVRAAREHLRIAKRSIESALLSPLPTLGFASTLAYTASPVLAPNTTFALEAVVTIPFYDGGVRYGQLRDARAQETQAEQVLEQTRLNAIVTAARAKRSVDVARADRDVSKTERDLAQQIDLRTRDAYARGAVRASTSSRRRKLFGSPRSTSPSSNSSSQKRARTPRSRMQNARFETHRDSRSISRSDSLAPRRATRNRPRAITGMPRSAEVGVITLARRDVPLHIEAVASLDGYDNADIRARVRGYLRSQDYKDGATVKEGRRSSRSTRPNSTSPPTRRARTCRARTPRSRARRIELDRDIGCSRAEISRSKISTTRRPPSRTHKDKCRRRSPRSIRPTSICRIRTSSRPSRGSRASRKIRVGNFVGQDQPTLLTTVSQTDPIRVNFPLSEIDYVKYPERFNDLDETRSRVGNAEFAKLDAGAQNDGALELLLSDGSRYPKRGVIVTANRNIDSTTGTIQMQALFPNPDGLLRPGQFGRIRMKRGEEGRQVIAVPEKALISVQGTYSLAVVGADDKVALKHVELGPSSGGVRVVVSGVAEGDRIVVDGTQRVTDGAIVAPHPVSDAPAPSASHG